MSDGRSDGPAHERAPHTTSPEVGPALRSVLDRSRDLGFLGPGPVTFHVEHAQGFVLAAGHATDLLDLGSGGGVPGLILARDLPATRIVLLDAMARRCRFLESAVVQLGLEDRVQVRCGRAEELAHEPDLRSAFDVVVTRGFGPPSVTAECAAGFLAGVGSRLLVSEPPGSVGAGRWPREGLEQLGLEVGEQVRTASSTIQVVRVARPVDDRFPRRTGVPAKRPLF